ncbi:RnfABCDGE type electron transport complex subunit D [Alkalinema sp. FACHB-956]|uniref:RnfABCDGE type electron transport complex subunit D n=1 Tax=Alkalinema sp. FACHB-956 TaxID=2692768 RepID=UPI001687899B|nr:RnfABCDGE type electron transport complex subunit D [Alkalinema sp. FACHB-956]MBD2325497.1 RnfABCDGE type electron transport complex subunit D [Alkalinema sp. FACHB-956]
MPQTALSQAAASLLAAPTDRPPVPARAIDARLYQILFLSLFLLLGLVTRDWTLHPTIILVAIVTCCATQAIAQSIVQFLQWRVEQKSDPWPMPSLQPSTYYSALITALGLSLLLRVDRWETMVLACSMAIASKFLLRVNQKHIFNPGNFGIISVLLLTHHAWVSPGQWGESAWYAALFLLCGGLVLQKVGRWDTTVAFLSVYVGLEAVRNLYLGWTWDVWGHRLMSGSLVMFALFMITDPRTIPNARSARLIWAAAIAALTFVLRNVYFLNTAVFWALFVLAPLTFLLDWLFQADRFEWLHPSADRSMTASPSLDR